MRWLPPVLILLVSAVAGADVPEAPPRGPWEGWSTGPWSWAPLLVLGAAWTLGWRRQVARSPAALQVRTRRRRLFAGAWIAGAVAVISPLDAWAGLLLSVHMVQHLLLALVVAPLLVAGRALPVALQALPRETLRRLVRSGWWRQVAAAGRWAVRPLPALALHGASLWIWHAPALYDRALLTPWLHALEHATFVAGAALFFEAIRRCSQAKGAQPGVGVLVAFGGALQATVLGALITFAPEPLYASHAGSTVALGLHPLDDQQRAGLLMWVPGNLVYVGLALWLLWIGLARAERQVRWDAAVTEGRKTCDR